MMNLPLAMVLTIGATAMALAGGADWPLYRHDARLTGMSPGRGAIVSPRVAWEYYLGTPMVPIASDRPPAQPFVADLDGDGQAERFSIQDRTLSVHSLQGELLWSYTVDGRPLGGIVRVCKLLADRPGQQVICFSHRMDTGEGQGYCFSFHRGAPEGELAWTTGPLDGYYSPTLIVDDVDGDGLPEVVTAPHYRVQIFNGQNGQVKAQVPWEVGRNYGVLLSRPRPGERQKDIFIICDFVLHVDCIRFQDGKWIHAWGHKYFEPNAPLPRGRESYIRVGPNPVADLDGDGRDEMVYMLVEAQAGDQWRLRVRDCETGQLRADVPGVWLWSVTDLDEDGTCELVYTPTTQKRPGTICDLHIGRLQGEAIRDRAVLARVRPLLMNATLPLNADSIADEGLQDLLRTDVDGDGRPELVCARRSSQTAVEDEVCAVGLGPADELQTRLRIRVPGHRLNVLHAGPDNDGRTVLRVRDLTDHKLLIFDASGAEVHREDLGRPGGFNTTPIVVDLDDDGTNEIVLQTAAGEISALRAPNAEGMPPTVLWSVPGVAMNRSPGYTPNGALCPQAADLDGDGRPEVLFAVEDAQGLCALRCVDGQGKERWTHSFEGCPWGGLQAGVNLWTVGRFTGRERGLDVYVDVHRRSKGSSEGWVLRGDTGEAVWRQQGLVAAATAMPFGGGIPAVADVNGDGTDDLVQEFYTVYAAICGATGEPLFPPAFLCDADHFGRWIAYSSPTVADLNGDGRLEVYLNSCSYARGGYATVDVQGRPLWVEFHDNDQGSDGFGPVGDFDGDGQVEIGVPVLNGTLLCLNAADGTRRWSIRTAVTMDVAAGDVNGDGIAELVFSQPDGHLCAVRGSDGAQVWSLKLPVPGHPIIADVDDDGLVEVVVVSYDGFLRVIDSSS